MSGGDNNGVVIVKHIAILKQANNGWTQELNIVRWYGKEEKYDIRWWSPDKTDSGKGVTMRKKEIVALKEALYNE